MNKRTNGAAHRAAKTILPQSPLDYLPPELAAEAVAMSPPERARLAEKFGLWSFALTDWSVPQHCQTHLN